MSFHDPQRPSAAARAPVARLEDLTEREAWCVAALRQWTEGPEGQGALWNALARHAGPAAARRVLAPFERLVGLIATHGRRVVMRRPVGCVGVGADEAAFAQLVDLAAGGQREDAFLHALVMVRADMAPLAIAQAEALGLELLRLRPAADGAAAPQGPPPGTRMH